MHSWRMYRQGYVNNSRHTTMMASTPDSTISVALQQRAGRIGIVAPGLCLVGMFFNPVQFCRSYLLAYSLGQSYTGLSGHCHVATPCARCLGRAHLAPPGSRFTRLPLMAGAFLPILIGSGALYVWTQRRTLWLGMCSCSTSGRI